MQRKINLGNGTQVLLNAVLDLERLTNEVYSIVQDEFSHTSGETAGQDIINASSELRKVLDNYLVDRYRTACMLTANQGETLTI